MMLLAGNGLSASGLLLSFDKFSYGLVRRNVVVRNFHLAVAKDVQRKVWDHLLGNPLPGFDWIFAPDGGTGRKNFDKGEAGTSSLQLQRLANGPPCFHDVLVVRESHAFDV